MAPEETKGPPGPCRRALAASGDEPVEQRTVRQTGPTVTDDPHRHVGGLPSVDGSGHGGRDPVRRVAEGTAAQPCQDQPFRTARMGGGDGVSRRPATSRLSLGRRTSASPSHRSPARTTSGRSPGGPVNRASQSSAASVVPRNEPAFLRCRKVDSGLYPPHARVHLLQHHRSCAASGPLLRHDPHCPRPPLRPAPPARAMQSRSPFPSL